MTSGVGNRGCSVPKEMPILFRRWRRKLARAARGFESDFAMRAVAEGLVFGVAATAQADGRASSQAERLSIGVLNGELAFRSQRAVIVDRDLG